MSQETWQIVQEMRTEDVELQMAFQCAPLITGLKISNLMSLDADSFERVKEITSGGPILWYVLCMTGRRVTVLLYRKERLEEYLKEVQVRRLLCRSGYRSFQLEEVLEVFRERYLGYMHNRESFPHEMGLILGYPAEDVEGFIRYEGKEYLCSGYWKVYKNEGVKRKLFRQYENARESLIQLLSCGMNMTDIIGICTDTGMEEKWIRFM